MSAIVRVLNVAIHHEQPSFRTDGFPQRRFMSEMKRVTVEFEVSPEALDFLLERLREEYGYPERGGDPGITPELPMQARALPPRVRELPPHVHDAYFDEDDET